MAGELLYRWRDEIRSSRSKLTPTARLVALNLGFYMDKHGGDCFPMIETQARETGLSQSAVKEAIGELKAGGWLTTTGGGGRPDKKRNNVLRYQAHVPNETSRESALFYRESQSKKRAASRLVSDTRKRAAGHHETSRESSEKEPRVSPETSMDPSSESPSTTTSPKGHSGTADLCGAGDSNPGASHKDEDSWNETDRAVLDAAVTVQKRSDLMRQMLEAGGAADLPLVMRYPRAKLLAATGKLEDALRARAQPLRDEQVLDLIGGAT